MKKFIHINKKILPSWILLISLQFIPLNCFTQKIENVVSTVSENNIHIYYDLSDIADDQPVFIRIFVSTDDGKSYGEPLKSVTGDVGMVVGAGERKQIIWNVFEEVDELVGESVKFKVKAERLLSNQGMQPGKPGYQLGLNANLGSKVHLASYGFNLKVTLNIKQLGFGVRGEYYKTYGAPPDGAGFDYYVGFSGGAVVEYDLIKDPRYSLYPYLCLGQTKIAQKGELITSEYAAYSIYYTPGVGFDFHLVKFIYLGVELEYCMAPKVEINDLESGTFKETIVLDGLCAGITLKFVIQPDN